jgi:hypothetical protein
LRISESGGLFLFIHFVSLNNLEPSRGLPCCKFTKTGGFLNLLEDFIKGTGRNKYTKYYGR